MGCVVQYLLVCFSTTWYGMLWILVLQSISTCTIFCIFTLILSVYAQLHITDSIVDLVQSVVTEIKDFRRILKYHKLNPQYSMVSSGISTWSRVVRLTGIRLQGSACYWLIISVGSLLPFCYQNVTVFKVNNLLRASNLHAGNGEF